MERRDDSKRPRWSGGDVLSDGFHVYPLKDTALAGPGDKAAIARSARLSVSPVTHADFDALFQADFACPEIARYYHLWQSAKGEATQPRSPSTITMVASLVETWDPLGGLELASDTLSFFVRPSFRRRGYATEMLTVCAETIAGRCNVSRLWARAARDNLGSRRVLQNAGFFECGMVVAYLDGRFPQKLVVYAKDF